MQKQKQNNAYDFGEFTWWMGVIVDRMDPEKLGRVRVRIFGYHTGDTGQEPNDDLFWASPMQTIISAAESGTGYSPTGMVESTHVFGFFADSVEAQQPIIMGTLAGKPVPGVHPDGDGFEDPGKPGGRPVHPILSGLFPRYPPGEQDVNRLARNEKIGETIVPIKKAAIQTSNIAFGGTWTEVPTPYAAKYPYNHVHETESGHIIENDDTPGAERMHRYHRMMTFEEIHPEGLTVHKIVDDDYRIIYGDERVLQKKNKYDEIKIDSYLLIGGDSYIEIMGNLKEYIHGNYECVIDGWYHLTVGAEQISKTSSIEKRTAQHIYLN